MRTRAVCTTRTRYARGIVTLRSSLQSQLMSHLSVNLTARRESLGLSVPGVHARMNRAGFPVAFSTVAGWFNGSRGVRSMKHLKALCAILETDLDTMTGDDIEVAEGPVNTTVVRELAKLSPTQREAVLALIRTMAEASK